MDPHSIATFLMESAGLKIPKTALDQYWLHHSTHGAPWAQNVSFDTIPVGVYGDSARVQTKFGHTNIVGLFLNFVLWKPPSVRMSRYLLFAIEEESLWYHFTLNTVLRRISWSLNAMVLGFHPNKGPWDEILPPHLQRLAGRPLANRFALVEVRGDWAWLKKIFRFHNRCSWNGLRVCHHCPAMSMSDNREDLYWTFDQPSWGNRKFNFAEFINERMPPSSMCCSVCIWYSVLSISIFVQSVYVI